MNNYNWWDDPANKEEVERISWWNHPENKTTFPLPISVINDGEWWVATCNDETKKYLGELHGCAQGKTREEAIEQMFLMLRIAHYYSEECRLNYQRFVPFSKGNWKHTGGKWFTILGFSFYFRVGDKMKGGKYVPFTKLNISVHSAWKVYREWKKKQTENE